MDDQKNDELEQEIPPELLPQPYTPRPAWQVWGARIAAGIVFVAFLLYCWQIAFGAP